MQSSIDKVSGFELNKETLAGLNNLEMPVEANFQPALDAVNAELGLNLKPRPEGFHVTLISPMERTKTKVLEKLTDAKVDELKRLSSELKTGNGIEVKGIGFIDGATAPKMREADKSKKVCFVALDIPAVQAFRESVGLPKKDLHITLSFEGGDIHMSLVEDGGREVKFIEKQADPNLDKLTDILPSTVSYGAISGEKKPEKKKKEAKPKALKAVVSYDRERLSAALTRLVESGQSDAPDSEKIQQGEIQGIVDMAVERPTELGRSLRQRMRLVKAALEESKK